MPFSIKRFVVHRTSSSPSGSRPDQDKKTAHSEVQGRSAPPGGGKEIKKSVSQVEYKAKPNEGFQSSHSLDSPVINRYTKQQHLPHGDDVGNNSRGNISSDALQRAQQECQNRSNFEEGPALPPRWRSPRRTRNISDSRVDYFQEQPAVDTEERKSIMKRDAVTRYLDQTSGVRHNEWMESKSGHSNKRQYSGQHQAPEGLFSEEHQNSNIEHENRQRVQRPNQLLAGMYEGDSGVMSEVETSATGFHRPSKGRPTIPTTRSPPRSQERTTCFSQPQLLAENGSVFLQCGKETKRSVLPHELTTLDTIKTLFVRAFPEHLTMDYLDSPYVRIYINDVSKDVFYELEDVREIRDGSVLRIYEQSVNRNEGFSSCDQESNYFSEPEFESGCHHQHIHQVKQGTRPPASSELYGRASPYPKVPVMPTNIDPGPPLRSYTPTPSEWRKRTQSVPVSELPRYETQRAYSETHPYQIYGQNQYIPMCETGYESGYDFSPERKAPPLNYAVFPSRLIEHQKPFGSYVPPGYEYPAYYRGQVYRPQSHNVDPLIDEEARKRPAEGIYQKIESANLNFTSNLSLFVLSFRKRMEFMEHQLANLTGLVEKVLTSPSSRQQSLVEEVSPTRDNEVFNENKEEKSVSFSDNTTEATNRHCTPKQNAANKSAKPAIKARSISKDYELSPELCLKLRYLRQQTQDLQSEVLNLRRIAQKQALSAREFVTDTCLKIKEMLAIAQDSNDDVMTGRSEMVPDEDFYRQDMMRVEQELSDLESRVEELRGNVINKRCRVSTSCVEDMALLLSGTSKTVADLKVRFPELEEQVKAFIGVEKDIVVKEERFLSEETDRLENALRRCKKLTGTLVTLKRLASVQEQRSTSEPEKSLSADGCNATEDVHPAQVQAIDPDSHTMIRVSPDDYQRAQQKEAALDDLLNELKSFNDAEEIKRDPSFGDREHFTPYHFESSSLGFSYQDGTIRLKSGSSSIERQTKMVINEGETRQDSLSLSSNRKQQYSCKPPYLPPKKMFLPPSSTNHCVVQSSDISTLPLDDSLINNVSSSQSKIRQANQSGQSNLQLLRSASDSLQRSVSNDVSYSKLSTNQIVRTRALDDFTRLDQSSSSSSESVNSQEGLLLNNGSITKSQLERSLSEGAKPFVKNDPKSMNMHFPQKRQEVLEYRHRELLNKQKLLQDQYTKLQHLQCAQLFIRSSPLPQAIGVTKPVDVKEARFENDISTKANVLLTSASTTPPTTKNKTNTGNHRSTVPMTRKKRKANTLPQSFNQIHETDII
ncbi:coiled-coil domain-containing protein CG32809-like [Tachypleus tridentatus]|uniref:coiled-coil domain-containing protein CG32809-like n=1 Tax=Tachypleus tridentatus TaxID=6853 RepID=UPI003FD12402